MKIKTTLICMLAVLSATTEAQQSPAPRIIAVISVDQS
jgi:hypothetical protein